MDYVTLCSLVGDLVSKLKKSKKRKTASSGPPLDEPEDTAQGLSQTEIFIKLSKIRDLIDELLDDIGLPTTEQHT